MGKSYRIAQNTFNEVFLKFVLLKSISLDTSISENFCYFSASPLQPTLQFRNFCFGHS